MPAVQRKQKTHTSGSHMLGIEASRTQDQVKVQYSTTGKQRKKGPQERASVSEPDGHVIVSSVRQNRLQIVCVELGQLAHPAAWGDGIVGLLAPWNPQ